MAYRPALALNEIIQSLNSANARLAYSKDFLADDRDSIDHVRDTVRVAIRQIMALKRRVKGLRSDESWHRLRIPRVRVRGVPIVEACHHAKGDAAPDSDLIPTAAHATSVSRRQPI